MENHFAKNLEAILNSIQSSETHLEESLKDILHIKKNVEIFEEITTTAQQSIGNYSNSLIEEKISINNSVLKHKTLAGKIRNFFIYAVRFSWTDAIVVPVDIFVS